MTIGQEARERYEAGSVSFTGHMRKAVKKAMKKVRRKVMASADLGIRSCEFRQEELGLDPHCEEQELAMVLVHLRREELDSNLEGSRLFIRW